MHTIEKLYNEITFKNIVNVVRNTDDIDTLRRIKKDVYNIDSFDKYIKHDVILMINKKIGFLRKDVGVVVSDCVEVESINNNLDTEKLETIKEKINKVKKPKLNYTLKGLFNLLVDNNLVYNELYKREQIIDFLMNFRFLNGFKIGYISINDLSSDYTFLSVKKGKIKNYTKIQLINNCIVLNTLNHDDISIKVIYVNKKDFNSLKKSKKSKNPIKLANKFNIDCLDFEQINKLSEQDRIIYYSYLKDNLLHKKNRKLLKSIRMASYTFSNKEELKEELIKELEELKKVDVKKLSDNIEVIYHYQDMEDINNEIVELDIKEDLFLNDIVEGEKNLSYKLKTYL